LTDILVFPGRQGLALVYFIDQSDQAMADVGFQLSLVVVSQREFGLD
jgi:hypothetical protein